MPLSFSPHVASGLKAELRKFAGVQFDPEVVDAFVKTVWVEGVPDAGRPSEPRPIPLLAQAAAERVAAGRADASIANTAATAVQAEQG